MYGYEARPWKVIYPAVKKKKKKKKNNVESLPKGLSLKKKNSAYSAAVPRANDMRSSEQVSSTPESKEQSLPDPFKIPLKMHPKL